MQGTWIERIRDRVSGAWDVLVGRAYAGYTVPDVMDGVRPRMALALIHEKIANRSFIDTAEIRSVVESALEG